jgi:hypothetical protein
MATEKQIQAAKRNVKKARAGAERKRSIANLATKTRTALGKQGGQAVHRERLRRLLSRPPDATLGRAHRGVLG